MYVQRYVAVYKREKKRREVFEKLWKTGKNDKGIETAHVMWVSRCSRSHIE